MGAVREPELLHLEVCSRHAFRARKTFYCAPMANDEPVSLSRCYMCSSSVASAE